jgi:hypothetical protein
MSTALRKNRVEAIYRDLQRLPFRKIEYAKQITLLSGILPLILGGFEPQ